MTLTNRSSRSLWKSGRRLPVKSLIAQAHVTLKKVAEDQPVARSLGPPFIAEMKAAVAHLEAVAGARSSAEVLAKAGTEAQDHAAKMALAWRRQFTNLAATARDIDPDVPLEAVRHGRALRIADLAADVERLVDLGHKFSAKLAVAGVTSDLLTQGKQAADALRTADAQQEYLRREARSDAVRRLWELAAVVHICVNRVNRVAHATYARSTEKARMYNLDILRGKAPAPGEAPPPAPEASVA